MFRHLWKKSTGWEMQFFPTNKDLGDQFASSKQDWNDSRGQRTMGPRKYTPVKYTVNLNLHSVKFADDM